MSQHLIEACKQALEALEHEAKMGGDNAYQRERDALRIALAEAEKQEPVAWRYRGNLHEFDPSDWAEGPVTPLYTTPPAAQRQWAGLTHDEMDAIYEQHHNQYGECESPNFGYERAIEAALKEKNT